MQPGIGASELAVILLLFSATAFWIWMLVDCATKEPNGREKIVWVVIIALTHFIGALIYFIIKRSQRSSLNKHA